MRLCVVCLVWSPGGGERFLRAVPPGDWSAPPPAAETAPSLRTGGPWVTGDGAQSFPRGYRDPSTFWKQGDVLD